ncbi:hypothetical protein FHETE_11296 [Fusarium heterosporum]|uniref:Fucose-specific lectin n=1 Tax=Fusarium heterosporum TaxID=42747 RepID=A0A8H5SMZ0_FUSHE|nr:hypothetical protein FHETE_11296 [Fusarium heterosporum]
MAAVAAVTNRSAPKNQQIQLFYNTSNAQIALDLRSGASSHDGTVTTWSASLNDYKGIVLNPSQVAAANLNEVPMVVAVTTPYSSDGSANVNNISLVSPVYQQLTTTDLNNSSVAMISLGDDATVYYVAGTSKDTTVIWQYGMISGINNTVVSGVSVLMNSTLGGWYDTNDTVQHLVFQAANGVLWEFDVAQQNPLKINNTDNSLSPAMFGVTFAVDTAYVYYVDNQSNLVRITKKGNTWGSSAQVQGWQVAKGSQITVTTANGLNHIFFVPLTGQSELGTSNQHFQHVTDPIQQ